MIFWDSENDLDYKCVCKSILKNRIIFPFYLFPLLFWARKGPLCYGIIYHVILVHTYWYVRDLLYVRWPFNALRRANGQSCEVTGPADSLLVRSSSLVSIVWAGVSGWPGPLFVRVVELVLPDRPIKEPSEFEADSFYMNFYLDPRGHGV